MSEPRLVTVKTYDGDSEFNQSLDDFIKKIQENIPEQFKKEAKITIDGSESVYVRVEYKRYETCEEITARELQEKQYAEHTKKYEMKQLKGLIEKYGIPKE